MTTAPPWAGDAPAEHLGDDALELLNRARDAGDGGRSLNTGRAMRQMHWSEQRVMVAAREVRASVFAGQYRPYKRVSVPWDTRDRVYKRDKWQCQMCGQRGSRPNPLTMGHWPVPYAMGASDHWTHLRAECYDCNHDAGCIEG